MRSISIITWIACILAEASAIRLRYKDGKISKFGLDRWDVRITVGPEMTLALGMPHNEYNEKRSRERWQERHPDLSMSYLRGRDQGDEMSPERERAVARVVGASQIIDNALDRAQRFYPADHLSGFAGKVSLIMEAGALREFEQAMSDWRQWCKENPNV